MSQENKEPCCEPRRHCWLGAVGQANKKTVPLAELLEEAVEQGGHGCWGRREVATKALLIGSKQQEGQEDEL